MAMTLAQLRYLVAVDTHRHFGHAAEACHVSQPTLSAQVRKLEGTLGVTVFDRSASPVRPTDAGAAVLAQARRVLAEADRLPELLSEAADAVAGELRLGLIPTLTPYLVPLLVPALRARHPGIELVVREWTTEHVLDALAADRLDAALIATDDARPGLEAEVLFDEPFVAYVGDGHPLAAYGTVEVASLDPSDLWLLSEGHCFRDQALALCEQRTGAAPGSVRFESGSLETLRLLVDGVGGVTLLPLLATRSLAEPALRRVRSFAEPVPTRAVRLVRPRGSLRAARIAACAEAVREVVAPWLGLDGEAGARSR